MVVIYGCYLWLCGFPLSMVIIYGRYLWIFGFMVIHGYHLWLLPMVICGDVVT